MQSSSGSTIPLDSRAKSDSQTGGPGPHTPQSLRIGRKLLRWNHLKTPFNLHLSCYCRTSGSLNQVRHTKPCHWRKSPELLSTDCLYVGNGWNERFTGLVGKYIGWFFEMFCFGAFWTGIFQGLYTLDSDLLFLHLEPGVRRKSYLSSDPKCVVLLAACRCLANSLETRKCPGTWLDVSFKPYHDIALNGEEQKRPPCVL